MQEVTLDTIALMLLEQSKAQAEQSKAQAEQSKAQTEQSKAQTAHIIVLQQNLDGVIQNLDIVNQKLDRIESNVIVIKGIVLSDFSGITESTKQEIEAAAEEALEEKEVIVGTKEFFEPKHPAFRTAAFKKIRKEIRANNVGSIVYQYDPNFPKNQLSSVGIWVNAQMAKIFGETLKGKYDRKVMPLVATLVGYYMVERTANGRLF